MRKGFLAFLAALVVGNGLATAQPGWPAAPGRSPSAGPYYAGMPLVYESTPAQPAARPVTAPAPAVLPKAPPAAPTPRKATVISAHHEATEAAAPPTAAAPAPTFPPPTAPEAESVVAGPPAAPEAEPIVEGLPAPEGDSCPPPPGEENRPDREPCHHCHVYASTEYLFWWIRKQGLPPLLTTGPPAGGGVPGTLGTIPVPGITTFDNQERSGMRATAGIWLNRDQCCGLEFSGFYLFQRTPALDVSSQGSPLLARPFIEATTGLPSAALVAAPGVLAGGFEVIAPSRLWSVEANLRRQVAACYGWHLDLLAGFRHMELDEGLKMQEQLFVLPNVAILGGTTTTSSDVFGTHTRFYGGQVGAEFEYHWCHYFVDLRGKVALGVNTQDVTITGGTVIATPLGIPAGTPSGLLARASNMGQHSREVFSVVPEVGINFGYQFCESVRAFAGYTFLFWSNVVRPADQIDRTITSNATIGAAMPAGTHPVFNFKESDFWAQGVNVGLEFRY